MLGISFSPRIVHSCFHDLHKPTIDNNSNHVYVTYTYVYHIYSYVSTYDNVEIEIYLWKSYVYDI